MNIYQPARAIPLAKPEPLPQIPKDFADKAALLRWEHKPTGIFKRIFSI